MTPMPRFRTVEVVLNNGILRYDVQQRDTVYSLRQQIAYYPGIPFNQQMLFLHQELLDDCRQFFNIPSTCQLILRILV